ncbi:hypothetical protein NX059_001317 [Plenodomus lindquistii]|nr:hypothetical protein NX059_001317 [Plenodomus lindquistii]
MVLTVCEQTPPAEWYRASTIPPTNSSAWYSLGYVRDTTSLLTTCCQSPATTFTPRESSINATDPGLKDCFTYCDITAPGLNDTEVSACVRKALKRAGVDTGYTETHSFPSKTEPEASGTVSIPVISASSTASQSAVAEGGAIRLGGAVGWMVLSMVVVSAIVGV